MLNFNNKVILHLSRYELNNRTIKMSNCTLYTVPIDMQYMGQYSTGGGNSVGPTNYK